MSVSFIDGPAGGQTLSLKRAPKLLRVVRSRNGTWDALDQLDDEPRPTETIVVYRRVGGFSQFHISCRPRSNSGWFVAAKYEVIDPQPADTEIRLTAAWTDWCTRVGVTLLQDQDSA